MNELQQASNQALHKWTAPGELPLTKQIQFASESAYVKDSDDSTLVQFIAVGLGRSKQLTGYNTSEFDVHFIRNEVMRELKANYKGLRVTEIGIFFDLWAKKQYGDWTGFTLSNIIQYGLKPYFKDPVRIENIKPVEVESEASIIEKQKDLKIKADQAGEKRFNELKAKFQETGACEDIGNIAYDLMMEKGMIKPGYGNQFYQEAKEQMLRVQRINQFDAGTKINLVKQIKKTIAEIEANANTSVIVLAKKMAVQNYFETEL